MKQSINSDRKHCDQKKTVVLEVNKTGSWIFPQAAEGMKWDKGDLHAVAVEIDGNGSFIEVWSNGERFEMGAEEVAELAASIIPASVLEALQAYEGTKNVPVRDLTKAQLKRIMSFEKRRLTA